MEETRKRSRSRSATPERSSYERSSYKRPHVVKDDNPYLTVRSLIDTRDASIIIGKGGQNIAKIRETSGIKLVVSGSIPNNPERLLTATGQLDAVSKAFGLVVRTINDEDFNQPSLPGSKAVTLKFAIPNMKMGFIIGRAGAKIKEIQEASGAKISTSEYVLPNSTERVLSIDGVADAVHIAIYHVGMILADQTAVPSKERGDRRRVQNQSYGDTSSYGNPTPYAAAPPVYGMLPTYASTVPAPPPAPAPASLGGAPPFGGYPTLPAAETTSQKIFVPNNLVGGLIGKGGSKINQIRYTSQCSIKILEPGEGEQTEGPSIERLVLISGPASGIQIAINMLSERIEIEKEKEKEKINPPL